MNKLINPVKNLFYGLSYLVVILFSAAILAYIIETSFGKNGEPVGFLLATIAAVIGGLILAGGLLNKGSSAPSLALGLRRIGAMYLVATLAFVVFGMCFPLIEVSHWFIYASAIGMAAGALSFAMGSVLLAIKVPHLFSGS